MKHEAIMRYLVVIALALPVAALATGDFIIAVNVQWGWKSEADGALVAIPLFVLLWAGLSWLAVAAGDMNRGALRLTTFFIAFSLCLPLAIVVQDIANDFRDPIFPPILILIATTVFVAAPMVAIGAFVRRAIARDIEREEGELAAPEDWTKKRMVAGLLLLLGFFGIHGVHRFYVGKSVMGLLMLMTLGGVYLWSLFDLAVMLRGRFTDGYGLPLKTARADFVVILGVFAAAALVWALLFIVSPDQPDAPGSSQVEAKGFVFECEELRTTFRSRESFGNEVAYGSVSLVMAIDAGTALSSYDSDNAKAALEQCDQ